MKARKLTQKEIATGCRYVGFWVPAPIFYKWIQTVKEKNPEKKVNDVFIEIIEKYSNEEDSDIDAIVRLPGNNVKKVLEAIEIAKSYYRDLGVKKDISVNDVETILGSWEYWRKRKWDYREGGQ